MTRRPPSCDGTECEPTERGWSHDPQCHAGANAGWAPDWREATDLEDGVAGRRPGVNSQQRSAA